MVHSMTWLGSVARFIQGDKCRPGRTSNVRILSGTAVDSLNNMRAKLVQEIVGLVSCATVLGLVTEAFSPSEMGEERSGSREVSR